MGLAHCAFLLARHVTVCEFFYWRNPIENLSWGLLSKIADIVGILGFVLMIIQFLCGTPEKQHTVSYQVSEITTISEWNFLVFKKRVERTDTIVIEETDQH